METIIEYLPFIIPIAIIELALMIISLIHVLNHDKYRFGNRTLWIIIVICFQLIGPVVYFTVGRMDD